MVIAFGSQFVELADHWLLDEPTPAQDVAPVRPIFTSWNNIEALSCVCRRIAARLNAAGEQKKDREPIHRQAPCISRAAGWPIAGPPVGTTIDR
ncbi:MAG: hypothetical protein ABIP08_09555 [Lautropia sp.]